MTELRSKCKSCLNVQGKRWRAANPEKMREINQKHRNYREANSDKISEQRRQARAANPEKYREQQRKWRVANPEKHRERMRRFREANRDKMIAYQQARVAAKRGNSGSYTAQEWTDLCNQFGNRCLACGADDVKLTVDHVVPVSRGGSNDIENIQPLCHPCNSRKGTKSIDYR